MLFNSASYALFLAIAYCCFWLLADRRRARTVFLVVASYVFYVFGTYETAVKEAQNPPLGVPLWTALCLGIIFVGSSLDFAIGRWMVKIQSPRRRLLLLLVSINYYLLVLAFFKYWNFAADNLAWLSAKIGHPIAAHHVHLILPFGISFFTFETMSYTIDVYRGQMKPAKSYGEYLLFVAFFPHLVAGPIVRPETMLPQLEARPVFDSDKQLKALFRIGSGLFKKVVIGDFLGSEFVGRIFDSPEHFSSLEVLVGVYAYAIQIYADFSGYSDIAIGSAQLFGYELPENFRAPYLSRNLQDFWRRWHISLSSWLRDYLYIPLGGSRGGSFATYRNLFLTMLLGGLWHGASWNFVIWGALHGVALGVVRAFQRARAQAGKPVPKESDEAVPALPTTLSGIVATLVTFHYVCFAWVFFRAHDFSHATAVLHEIGALRGGGVNLTSRLVAIVLLGFVLHMAPERFYERARTLFARSPLLLQSAAVAAFAIAVHLLASAREQPFVYGQF